MFNLTSIHDTCYRWCSTWRPSIAMHPSALRQRLWPYSICFLDVYLVCHGDGLTTKRRQPLWTSVQISESMRFRTHVYLNFFLVLVCTTTSQNIIHLFLTSCIATRYCCDLYFNHFNLIGIYIYIWGRRVIGISGSLIGQKLWWNWYLTPVVNFGDVRLGRLAKSTLLISSLVLLGSFQIF